MDPLTYAPLNFDGGNKCILKLQQKGKPGHITKRFGKQEALTKGIKMAN